MRKISHILIGPTKTTVVYRSGKFVPYYHDISKLPKTVTDFIRDHPEDVFHFQF